MDRLFFFSSPFLHKGKDFLQCAIGYGFKGRFPGPSLRTLNCESLSAFQMSPRLGSIHVQETTPKSL